MAGFFLQFSSITINSDSDYCIVRPRLLEFQYGNGLRLKLQRGSVCTLSRNPIIYM